VGIYGYIGFMKTGRPRTKELIFKKLLEDTSKLSDPREIQAYITETQKLSTEEYSSELLDIAHRIAIAQLTRLCAAGDTKAISLVLEATKAPRKKPQKTQPSDATPAAFLPQERSGRVED